MKLTRNYIIAAAALILLIAGAVFLWTQGVGVRYQTAAAGEGAQAGQATAGLAQQLRRALKGAQTAEEPVVITDADPIPITAFSAAGKPVKEYLLYVISMMDRQAYLCDTARNTWYRLSAAGFAAFLSDPAFDGLPAQRLPALAVTLVGDASGTVIVGIATRRQMQICKADGTFLTVTDERTNDPFEIKNDYSLGRLLIHPKVNADADPDRFRLECYRGTELLITQKNTAAEDLYFPTLPGEYTYVLTPVWDLTPQRDWYGEMTYEFHFSVRETG